MRVISNAARLGAATLGLTALLWSGAAYADLVATMVDISSYQDVSAVIAGAKAADIELVMNRATIGIDQPDAKFAASLAALRKAKIWAGAYHALVAADGPGDTAHAGAAQAKDFIQTVAAACHAGEPVLLAVDWEPPTAKGGWEKPRASTRVMTDFLVEVRRVTGARPLIYSNIDTLRSARSDPDAATAAAVLTQSPLWLASYHRYLRLESDPGDVSLKFNDDAVVVTLAKRRTDTLVVPAAADFAPWSSISFWQFSEGGSDGLHPKWPPVTALEPSIPAVDANYFRGTRTQFRKFFTDQAWKCDPKLAEHWPESPTS